MADKVLAPFITVGGVKFPAGAVVEVPEGSRVWLIGCGYIEPTNEAPEAPAMTPAAAAAIAEHGLDTAAIRGTGSGGRITLGDVEDHLANAAAAEPTDDEPEADDAQ
jgi:pyruvate/2-oxoglutarate dehydrogenase complex dihydrolipoamide acyltransferase (E2) component